MHVRDRAAHVDRWQVPYRLGRRSRGCLLVCEIDGSPLTTSKAYIAEISPPSTRGRFLGLVNSCYYFGQILGTGISIPFGYNPGNWSWRAPLLLQCAPAAINLSFVLLLPETPRWLYAHGHTDKAIRILADLHSRDRDINSPLVRLEIGEIEESISLTGADKRFWDLKAIFNTAPNRRRAFIAGIVAVWQTVAGNGLVTCTSFQ